MSSNKDHNSRWPAPGLTHVPEYQLSGLPFCQTKSVPASGNASFTFPKVTRWITVSSTVDVKIFFADDPDSAGNPHDNKYFLVPGGTTTLRLELRCAKLYVQNTVASIKDVSVIAGLTHIDSSNSVPETILDWDLS